MLKKRKTQDAIAKQRAADKAAARAAAKTRSTEAFKHAEKYVKEYRAQENDAVRLRRAARKNGEFYVPEEPKVAFVIRIRGIIGVSPKVRKILQLLRLRQINNGVFVRMNKATISMLRLVEPYVAYG